MSINQVQRFEVECDSCGATFEWDEETVLFDSAASAKRYVETDRDWSADGEGKHHCPSCDRLTLSAEAKSEQARALGPGDVPLEGLTS